MMSEEKVDMFFMSNKRFFKQRNFFYIKEQLLQADESKWTPLQFLQFKDPTITIIISLLFGTLGIDRFFIGDIFFGVLKLFTFGGLGIWTIIDWFIIMDITKERNLQVFQQAL